MPRQPIATGRTALGRYRPATKSSWRARSQLPTIPHGGVYAINTPAGVFRVTPTGALLPDLGDE